MSKNKLQCLVTSKKIVSVPLHIYKKSHVYVIKTTSLFKVLNIVKKALKWHILKNEKTSLLFKLFQLQKCHLTLKESDITHTPSTSPNLLPTHGEFNIKFSYIFWTVVVKFCVNIQNTLVDINRNVAWKLENMITTLYKTINNISTIYSYYF